MAEPYSQTSKVSAIIPTYNCSQYVCEAIESVLNQTYKDIEIIVVDDGSTDNTREVLEPYIESKSINYIFQVNKGPGAARNTGIRIAKGEFIAFIDADDLWNKDKIRLQISAIGDAPDSIVLTGIARFHTENRNHQGLGITFPPEYKDKSDYVRTLVRLNNNSMANFATALVRRSHAVNVGLFDEKINTAEDWDLWVRLACHYKFININQPLHLYRKYDRSLTRRFDLAKTLKNQIYIIEKVSSANILPRNEINSAIISKYLEFGKIFLDRNKLSEVYKLITKIFLRKNGVFEKECYRLLINAIKAFLIQKAKNVIN
jgi:glycosyltransferase involved in cell wall biosynthesis